jgi:hypothetical protein
MFLFERYCSVIGLYFEHYGWCIVGLICLLYISKSHIKSIGNNISIRYVAHLKRSEVFDLHKIKVRENQQKQNWQIELDRLV